MRYLGSKGGWRELATACLRNAIKAADVGCVHDNVFSIVCGLAGQEESEVITQLKFAESMKLKYGDKWYNVLKELYGKDWYRRIGL